MQFRNMTKRFIVPNNASLNDEFAGLNSVGPSSSFNVAEHFLNEGKNRYSNVLADDETRVMLNDDGYINANYVLDEYISTQAPIASNDFCKNGTISDFWLMVWEQRSPIIVMLTKFRENGKRKADPYWPKLNEQLTFGNIAVCNVNVINLGSIIVTKLELRFADETRVVHHMHYHEWPDQGVPNSTDNLRFLISLINIYQTFNQKLNGRIICHCSAGIGRAGTFIASHHIISLIDNGTDVSEIHVPTVVSQMRKGRTGMVQRVEQYKFIYRTANDWINQRATLPSKKRRLSKTRSLCTLPSYIAKVTSSIDERDLLTSSHGVF